MSTRTSKIKLQLFVRVLVQDNTNALNNCHFVKKIYFLELNNVITFIIVSQHWDCIGGSNLPTWHYTDVIIGAITSQITSFTIVYSIVYSDADQRKHQSSASLAFVRGIHRGPVNSPYRLPVTRKMFPFDDVIMGRQWSSYPHNQYCGCGWYPCVSSRRVKWKRHGLNGSRKMITAQGHGYWVYDRKCRACNGRQ